MTQQLKQNQQQQQQTVNINNKECCRAIRYLKLRSNRRRLCVRAVAIEIAFACYNKQSIQFPSRLPLCAAFPSLADSEMTQIVHQSSLERDALANINQLNVVALHEPN